jgi:hypothetical protein
VPGAAYAFVDTQEGVTELIRMTAGHAEIVETAAILSAAASDLDKVRIGFNLEALLAEAAPGIRAQSLGFPKAGDTVEAGTYRNITYLVARSGARFVTIVLA